MNNLKIKAYQLVADLIDSAIIGGWEFGDDEKESIAIEKEIRKIEQSLLYKIKKSSLKSVSVSFNEIQDNYGNIIHDFEEDKYKLLG